MSGMLCVGNKLGYQGITRAHEHYQLFVKFLEECYLNGGSANGLSLRRPIEKPEAVVESLTTVRSKEVMVDHLLIQRKSH